MPHSLTAIIGANYGDEGKGLFTNYFAPSGERIVVRFNGGAQAGHTVCTKDGFRHVYSHFGSGTHNGVPTYLSQYFVINPIIFRRERLELLGKLRINFPNVFTSPDCIVTTPFDILINQISELEFQKNGSPRGSVGIGFNETIKRNESFDKMTVYHMRRRSKARLVDDLLKIRDRWVLSRLETLGSSKVDKIWSDILNNNDIIYQYLEDIEYLMENITINSNSWKNYRHIIFEGAQGLRLDKGNQNDFPHLTNSHTGLKNVTELLSEMSTPTLDVIYITRPYVTRHGVGPLSHEILEKFHNDETNIHNKFQGPLRFGHFDYGEFIRHIERDIRYLTGRRSVTSVGISCMDHYDKIPLKENFIVRKKEFIDQFYSRFRRVMISSSPYSENVV